jgi:hypothetical protein
MLDRHQPHVLNNLGHSPPESGFFVHNFNPTVAANRRWAPFGF